MVMAAILLPLDAPDILLRGPADAPEARAAILHPCLQCSTRCELLPVLHLRVSFAWNQVMRLSCLDGLVFNACAPRVSVGADALRRDGMRDRVGEVLAVFEARRPYLGTYHVVVDTEVLMSACKAACKAAARAHGSFADAGERYAGHPCTWMSLGRRFFGLKFHFWSWAASAQCDLLFDRRDGVVTIFKFLVLCQRLHQLHHHGLHVLHGHDIAHHILLEMPRASVEWVPLGFAPTDWRGCVVDHVLLVVQPEGCCWGPARAHTRSARATTRGGNNMERNPDGE